MAVDNRAQGFWELVKTYHLHTKPEDRPAYAAGVLALELSSTTFEPVRRRLWQLIARARRRSA